MSQDETAVNEPVVAQEPTTTDSAPVENNEPEVADPVLEELSNDEDKSAKPETEDEPSEEPKEEPKEAPVEETPAEEKPQGKAEERKQQLNSEIRDLVATKKQLREEVEQLNAQVYQPRTAEDFVEEGYSEEVAEVKALKEDLALQKFNNQVVEAQVALGEQSGQVIKDYPIFDPDSPEFQPEIAASAAQALEKSLIIDPNTNQIIGSHLSPVEIYKPIADAFERAKVSGQIQGQKSTEKMLASVDTPTSATPRKPKIDPVLSILSSDDD